MSATVDFDGPTTGRSEDMITIQDTDGRQVRFEGDLIGEATSREPRSLRWSETRIWRTRAGSYIVQKVGRTLVFHSTSGRCRTGEKVAVRDIPRDQLANLIPCPKCRPDAVTSAQEDDEVRLEEDRYTVHISETARGAVECCRSVDDDGVQFTTWYNADALRKASEVDEDIRAAYAVRVVQ